VQVGVRSWCAEQDAFMKKASRRKIRGRKALTVFPASKIVGCSGWQKKVADSLSKNVYLTLDLDGLDPGVIPSVGTPEPGGLGWFETLELFKEVIRRRRLVGMDMVELKPIQGDIRGDLAAARMLHHILAYISAFQQKP
jgi:agmatinase